MPETKTSEEVHSEILSWGSHLLKISSWVFLLVAVERNDPRKQEQCTLVGKLTLLPWIVCMWRGRNPGGVRKSLSYCPYQATCELVSPCTLPWLVDLWYLSHSVCGLEMFLLSTERGVMDRRCACVCPSAPLVWSQRWKNFHVKIVQELWNNRKPQCRLETCSQGCPERQWKESINHVGYLPYFL